MFKKLTTGLAIILSTVAFSQVGIGTVAPHASSELDLGSANKALYLNRVADPVTQISNPQPGMMVYDTTMHCVRLYQGNPAKWSDCLIGGDATVAALNCGSAVFSPSSATVGTAYTGTLTVPYTGGNGGSYAAQTLSQNGLTFTLPEGSFSSSGNLVYNITGTPATAGSVSVNVIAGGQSCNGLSLPVNLPVGTVASLACGSAVFNPTAATVGTAYNGSLTIPYTGGNGGTYAAQSITQNGLTFALPAGTFATGAGNLTYNITGTPATAGAVSINVTAGGQSCNGLTLNVNQNPTGVLPSNITLLQNRRHWIASVYDTDYLPYTTPSGAASTAVVNADGTPEAKTVDVQGSITVSGTTVQIPVATVTGSGTVGAWTSTFVVPAMYAEDGISRTLELSWASQSYTASSTYITATIKSLSGTFNAKKLDINAGIGSDYLGLLLGAFQYPYNNAGTLTSYQVRDIPGIPDKMFGLTDNTPAAGQRHNFLYLLMKSPTTQKVWLNHNLGANYTNIDNANFNLAQEPNSLTDADAYGSLFQWGRRADGHEFPSSTYVNGAVNTDTPSHSNIIGVTSSTNFDWRSPKNDNLWQGEAGINNPCPRGFRLPTKAEWQAEGITNNTAAFDRLKLTYSGWRNYTSSSSGGNPGGVGAYWSSTRTGNYSTSVSFNSFNGSLNDGNQRANANAVRCIED